MLFPFKSWHLILAIWCIASLFFWGKKKCASKKVRLFLKMRALSYIFFTFSLECKQMIFEYNSLNYIGYTLRVSKIDNYNDSLKTAFLLWIFCLVTIEKGKIFLARNKTRSMELQSRPILNINFQFDLINLNQTPNKFF